MFLCLQLLAIPFFKEANENPLPAFPVPTTPSKPVRPHMIEAIYIMPDMLNLRKSKDCMHKVWTKDSTLIMVLIAFNLSHPIFGLLACVSKLVHSFAKLLVKIYKKNYN